jgi:uncharacterized membrane protein (DUF2068 family)
VDWNRRTCARRGHVTYSPDEDHLRDRLHVPTPVGEAWRCLRCGDYSVGAPHGAGPAERAPRVLRGRAAREVAVLRALSLERALRALLTVIAAYGIWRYQDTETALRRVVTEDLPPLSERVSNDLAHAPAVQTIAAILTEVAVPLAWISGCLLGYAALQLIVAVGLWFAKRWGAYLAVTAISVTLPLEIYEIIVRVSWFRVGALTVALAAGLYLLLAQRLLGVRGGRTAVERARHAAALREVEHAAALPEAEHAAVR